jgi:hypothetical protein
MIRRKCVLNHPISPSARFIHGLCGSMNVFGRRWFFLTLSHSVKAPDSSPVLSVCIPSSGMPTSQITSCSLCPQSALDHMGLTVAKLSSLQNNCAHVFPQINFVFLKTSPSTILYQDVESGVELGGFKISSKILLQGRTWPPWFLLMAHFEVVYFKLRPLQTRTPHS